MCPWLRNNNGANSKPEKFKLTDTDECVGGGVGGSAVSKYINYRGPELTELPDCRTRTGLEPWKTLRVQA